MAAPSAATRWLLAIPFALLASYTLLCMGLYIIGARHLPDRLVPTAWRATPELRAQLLRVEAGLAPGDTLPRLHPLTFAPRMAPAIRAHVPAGVSGEGRRLLGETARMLYSQRGMDAPSRSHHLPEAALTIRLSREWTTDDIVDTLLADSVYGRCSSGIEQAAPAYFGVPLEQLRPQETLALIVLRKGPAWYDLDRNRERFSARYARMAARLGQGGPAWSADAALARLRAPACRHRNPLKLSGTTTRTRPRPVRRCPADPFFMAFPPRATGIPGAHRGNCADVRSEKP